MYRKYVTTSICLLAGLVLSAGVLPGELLPLTEFYDTPESFTATGKPGELIRSERYDGYKLSQGVTATRILYGTTSSQGDLVASSGVVLVPPGEPPAGGWPVIAWAHGTSGVNRKCAPSLMAGIFSDYQAPNTWTELGYAVVATDYAGLGSHYSFAYMDRISMGWDVINSVRAARQALPVLGEKWLAVGHSAGGRAMRGVAELEVGIDDPSYLGVIALSGPGDARAPMVVLSETAPWLAMYILQAVEARDPAFNPADILTPEGQGVLQKAMTECEGRGAGGLPDWTTLTAAEVLQPRWDLNPFVDEYFKLDETGQEKYRGPVLVITGENEIPAILKNDLLVAEKMCQQNGLQVQIMTIPGATHGSLLGASIEEQVDWIEDRIAGREILSNCEILLE